LVFDQIENLHLTMKLHYFFLYTSLSHVAVQATFSIAAVDHKTKQVGAAGASCKEGGNPTAYLYGSVPGRGVFCAQYSNDDWVPFDDIRARLSTGKYGKSPEEIIDYITQDDYGYGPEDRQYGIVSLKKGKKHEPAGYTGDDVAGEERIEGQWVMTYKDDVQGKAKKDFSYAVQGNTLTGAEVIDNMEEEFKQKRQSKRPEKECDDLAQRLFDAIMSQDDDEGDARCTGPYGFPADTYFIHIDNPDGPANKDSSECPGVPCGGSEDAYLHIYTDSVKGVDPRSEFVEEFNKWRAGHDCLKRHGPGAGVKNGFALTFLLTAVASAGIMITKKRRRVATIDISEGNYARKEGAATELRSTTAYVMDYNVCT
jgi:uncharacterized Ntn-hydrolase superfamily protein